MVHVMVHNIVVHVIFFTERQISSNNKTFLIQEAAVGGYINN